MRFRYEYIRRCGVGREAKGIEDVIAKSEVAAMGEGWTENTPATIDEKCKVDGCKLQLGETERKRGKNGWMGLGYS